MVKWSVRSRMSTGVHCCFQIGLLQWSGFRLRQGWTGTKNKWAWDIQGPSQPTTDIRPRQHCTKHSGMFKSFSHDSTFVQYGVRWFNVPLFMTQFTPILGLGLDLIFWEVILLWHYISADGKHSEIKLGQINYCLPGSICNIHNCARLEMQNCVRHRFTLMLILGLVANSNGGLNETEQG